MSGKQLSLDSRMDLVQRLVTDRENGSQIDESAENESDVEETSSGIDGMGHKRWIDGLIFFKLKVFFFFGLQKTAPVMATTSQPKMSTLIQRGPNSLQITKFMFNNKHNIFNQLMIVNLILASICYYARLQLHLITNISVFQCLCCAQLLFTRSSVINIIKLLLMFT